MLKSMVITKLHQVRLRLRLRLPLTKAKHLRCLDSPANLPSRRLVRKLKGPCLRSKSAKRPSVSPLKSASRRLTWIGRLSVPSSRRMPKSRIVRPRKSSKMMKRKRLRQLKRPRRRQPGSPSSRRSVRRQRRNELLQRLLTLMLMLPPLLRLCLPQVLPLRLLPVNRPMLAPLPSLIPRIKLQRKIRKRQLPIPSPPRPSKKSQPMRLKLPSSQRRRSQRRLTRQLRRSPRSNSPLLKWSTNLRRKLICRLRISRRKR